MKRLGFFTLGALAISLLAGCSGGSGLAPSGAPDASSATRTAMSAATLTGLTGRIVYVGSKGLRIYNLATGADVSLGVSSGVNPKFSPNGALITYQNRGIYVMNSDGTNKRLLNATGNLPSFDPTSTKIAYADSGIWTVSVNGGTPTKITSDGGGGIHPVWSPDGTQIAYHAPVGGVAQLFTIPSNGGISTPVCSSVTGILDVVWLPSSKILFAVSVANSGWELETCDPANSSLTRLTATGTNYEPSWSPDAMHISWSNETTKRTAGIWIMNADGTGQQGPVIAGGRQGSWGP